MIGRRVGNTEAGKRRKHLPEEVRPRNAESVIFYVRSSKVVAYLLFQLFERAMLVNKDESPSFRIQLPG